jgi:hypothetical protein
MHSTLIPPSTTLSNIQLHIDIISALHSLGIKRCPFLYPLKILSNTFDGVSRGPISRGASHATLVGLSSSQ